MAFEPLSVTISVDIGDPDANGNRTIVLKDTQTSMSTRLKWTGDYEQLKSEVEDLANTRDALWLVLLRFAKHLKDNATAGQAKANLANINGKVITFDLSQPPNSIFTQA